MKTKLISAFLLVTIIVVLAISGAIYFSTNIIFNQYLDAKHENKIKQWVEFLTIYFEEYGSFDDLELVSTQTMIRGNPQQNRMMMGQRMPRSGQNQMQFENQDELIIADKERLIVYDSKGIEQGDVLEEREYNKGAPIMVNQEQVGILVIRDAVTSTVLSLEDQFASSINRSILYASILTLILAGIIGLVLSANISKHLLQLREGVRQVTAKNYKNRLVIDSNDEIGELANSFNDMVDKIQKDEHIKNQLITDIAHELRTPITTLRGKLEMMQNAPESVNQKEILILHDEVLRLSKLINDLQEVSLLEDERLPMNMNEVDIHHLIDHVSSLFSWEIEEKGISLLLTLDAIEHQIYGDRNRLIQIFINLITNSIRYLDKEDKEIQIMTRNSDESLIIEVNDTGQGIRAEELDNLFQRFYRGDPSRNRSSGGTGLGLAITKGLVEAQGGTISVSSEEGIGTRFIIEFPLSIERTL